MIDSFSFDERGINNSVVLLTPPPELSLIGTSYLELPRSCVRCHVTAHVTSVTALQLFQQFSMRRFRPLFLDFPRRESLLFLCIRSSLPQTLIPQCGKTVPGNPTHQHQSPRAAPFPRRARPRSPEISGVCQFRRSKGGSGEAAW